MAGLKVSDLLGMSETLSKIIDKFFERRDRLTERDKSAQEKVCSALKETRLYLAEFREGKLDREKERSLSELWREASIALREVDRDLADRCYMKMDYWADPERWSAKDIERAKIALDQVSEKIRQTMFRDPFWDN